MLVCNAQDMMDLSTREYELLGVKISLEEYERVKQYIDEPVTYVVQRGVSGMVIKSKVFNIREVKE